MPPSKISLSSNPIRVAREAQGQTLDQFAKRTGVHLQALYLNECGVYPRILPKIRNYLVHRLEYSEAQLIYDYFRFVDQVRAKFKEHYFPYVLPESLVGLSPVVAWREFLGLSRASLCKELCVQPSLLYRVEKGRTPDLPDQLKYALIQVEFDKHLLDEMEYRVEEFYNAL